MLRYLIYIFIAGIIMYMLLGLLKPKTVKAPGKSSKDDSIKSFDKVKYLGVNFQVELAKASEGTLHIYKDSIVFDDGISELFPIPIKNITKCFVESDSEKRRYVRIKFSSIHNSTDNAIFYSYFNEEYSNDIAQEINNRLLKYK